MKLSAPNKKIQEIGLKTKIKRVFNIIINLILNITFLECSSVINI